MATILLFISALTYILYMIQQEQLCVFALLTINNNEDSKKDIRQAQIFKRQIQVLRSIVDKYCVRAWSLWLALEVIC